MERGDELAWDKLARILKRSVSDCKQRFAVLQAEGWGVGVAAADEYVREQNAYNERMRKAMEEIPFAPSPQVTINTCNKTPDSSTLEDMGAAKVTTIDPDVAAELELLELKRSRKLFDNPTQVVATLQTIATELESEAPKCATFLVEVATRIEEFTGNE